MCVLNICIDTNIYLSFYYLTNDDLEELKKLSLYSDSGNEDDYKLLLPEQICSEFTRNRESKVQEALKKLRGQKLNLEFPQVAKGYGNYDELRRAQQAYQEEHDELINKIEEDATNHQLKADNTIDDIFDASEKLATENVIDLARKRQELGNPPEAGNNLGDAIIWETLLDNVPHGEDLCLITDDGDFRSRMNSDEIRPFLMEEWQEEKSSEIFLYTSLTEFSQDHLPDVDLTYAKEKHKNDLIMQLKNSSSFNETHKIINELSSYSSFAPTHTNNIVQAAIENSQVRWIIHDPDVEEFLKSVIEGEEGTIDNKDLDTIKELLFEEEEEEKEEEIPF